MCEGEMGRAVHGHGKGVRPHPKEREGERKRGRLRKRGKEDDVGGGEGEGKARAGKWSKPTSGEGRLAGNVFFSLRKEILLRLKASQAKEIYQVLNI